MCLAVPAKILEINGDLAKVDFGGGVMREVNIMLVDARVGDYVLVHAGYAIQVLDEKEAEETLMLWREIIEIEDAGAP
ncbi:MAG: HypC/HybG/HupF family hydrogenase formation chaperone [Candidatus Bathyarchaeia archaeon]|nr:HypC/HybG/HupF family hydrogenase formation chaperone [Candidatus Bathyarchaeota archaeon]